MDDFIKSNPFRSKSGKYKKAIGQDLTMGDLPEDRLDKYKKLMESRKGMKPEDYDRILNSLIADDNSFLKMWNKNVITKRIIRQSHLFTSTQ